MFFVQTTALLQLQSVVQPLGSICCLVHSSAPRLLGACTKCEKLGTAVISSFAVISSANRRLCTRHSFPDAGGMSGLGLARFLTFRGVKNAVQKLIKSRIIFSNGRLNSPSYTPKRGHFAKKRTYTLTAVLCGMAQRDSSGPHF